MTKLQNGIDFVISINGTKVAGQRGGSLSRSSENIEITSKDGKGWKSFAPSFKEWGIEADGVVAFDDKGYMELEKAYLNGDLVDVAIKMGETTSVYEGQALISDFGLEMSYDDLLGYSMSLTGTGELVFTNPTPIV